MRDRGVGSRIAVFNTHLDVKGGVARLEAAKIIINEVTLTPGVPTVVMGDFNADEDSEPLAVFRAGGLQDTFRDMHPDAVDVQTVHHYREFSGTRKLDYIMRDERWKVLSAGIVRDPAAGRLPSDHFPVIAELLPLLPGSEESAGGGAVREPRTEVR